jgi:hypothetical protein
MATSCGAKNPLEMFQEIEAKLYPLLSLDPPTIGSWLPLLRADLIMMARG